MDNTAIANLITANLPDNSSGLITPALLRQVLEAIKSSYPNLIDQAALFGLAEYDTNINYTTGQAVVRLGAVYQANKNTTGVFTAADWDVISTSPISESGVALYENATDYPVDALVAFEGIIYRSLQNPNSGNVPNITPLFWESLVFDSTAGAAYQIGAVYFAGAIVSHHNQLFICDADTYIVGTDFQNEVENLAWLPFGGVSIAKIITANQIITIPPRHQIIIYGDLVLQGRLVQHPSSSLIIINGMLDVDGGIHELRGDATIEQVNLKQI